MTRLRELSLRERSLSEIRHILNSMKALAYMEMRKLVRRVECQRRVVGAIERGVQDFHDFYGVAPESSDGVATMLIAIGSERGFCGDFNERIRAEIDQHRFNKNMRSPCRIITIGNRLTNLIEADKDVSVTLRGADTADEVEVILATIAEALGRGLENVGATKLAVIYSHEEQTKAMTQALIPMERMGDSSRSKRNFAPLLQMIPAQFVLDLNHFHLWATLQQALCTSLYAENRQRVQHLEGAVRYLDKELARLKRANNLARQEAIIEEIEVILMSASMPGKTERHTREP